MLLFKASTKGQLAKHCVGWHRDAEGCEGTCGAQPSEQNGFRALLEKWQLFSLFPWFQVIQRMKLSRDKTGEAPDHFKVSERSSMCRGVRFSLCSMPGSPVHHTHTSGCPWLARS